MGWQFDPYSALIGAGFTLLLIGLLAILHAPFLRVWQEVKTAGLRVFHQMTAGAEARYRERVCRWAQCLHALAEMGPLEQYFIPPALIPPLPHPDPTRDAPGAPQPLSLTQALKGHPRLLVVGGLASGRTTLLAYMALLHARKESSLPDPERVPFYVYLPALDWTPPREGKKPVPPVKKLVQGALRSVGASGIVAPFLQQSAQAGTALIMLDGWDEMPPADQEAATLWITNLADSIPGNFWVVAVGAQRYAPLTDAGFVPLRLQPWDRSEVRNFLTRLPTAEKFPLDRATENLTLVLKRTCSLLDVALCVQSVLEDGSVPSKRADIYHRWLDKWTSSFPPFPSAGMQDAESSFPPVQPYAILRALALKLQEEGRFVLSRQELEAFISELVRSSQPDESENKRVASITSWLLKVLLIPGSPLVACAPDCYRFAHPLWQALLVAEELSDQSSEDLVAHLDDPRWLPVVDFYAEMGAMEPIVRAWLSQPDDFWQSRLRMVARWAALASPGAPWRNGVMALLGRLLLTHTLSPEARQRLAEALIWTGDPGVPIFLRHALQNPSQQVRTIAAQMMGVLREPDLSGLTKALEDPSESVRVAAVRSLGKIGVPAALEWLTHTLTSGDEVLQVEAARALACRGEDGHKVLQEAIQHEDFMVRRAAVYGLGDIEALWARELLEKAAREDPQWIVRSAALAVLSEREQKAQAVPPQPPPVPANMGWLIAWAAEKGEGVGLGEAAFGPLLKALADGTAPIRRAAVQTLGLVGRPEHLDALRRAVRDPDPEVAGVAQWALEELSARYGLFVPA